MRRVKILFIYSILFFFVAIIYSSSPTLKTFINPIIPGDHPDPTLTKIGDNFYTSGSSFNPTPKIYHSTDLVHWEAIAQPVSASWSQYGDEPGGGIWGGHTVYYNNKYWHFFGRGGGSMYFVKAEQPEGPWSSPSKLNVPESVPGLGVDNSIFIDDDGIWYLLAKNGRENNYIIELGENGQPSGEVYDLTWLNPDAKGNPYGWAEGPVMWKYNGYYYYSFAQHLAGAQYVMRSDTLSEDESDWTIMNNGNDIFVGTKGDFNRPNHMSPTVMLDDSTSWVIAHAYYEGIGSNWMAQGRQGVLCQLRYDSNGKPEVDFPSNKAVDTPDLPSSGISWMVPKSDMFESDELHPEWSFLGYTPEDSYSLTEKKGWLTLHPPSRLGSNTVIKNDGEHNYTLITRVNFNPEKAYDEAGLWIINGPENLAAKIYSTQNSSDQDLLALSFDQTKYTVGNTIGSVVWMKLVRNSHEVSGYYSSDGDNWIQLGNPIDITAMDQEQTQFNDFTGNQQGLYTKGNSADFDLYIYRDAYSYIAAQYPANYFGVTPGDQYLSDINNGDWAMYAGVEFGKQKQPEVGLDYQRTPDSIRVLAFNTTSSGNIEVWMDSIETGNKIASGSIDGSEGDYDFYTFSVDSISGRHDVYFRFTGPVDRELFRVKSFKFTAKNIPTSIDNNQIDNDSPKKYSLAQNYPNPFNPTTKITYSIPEMSHISLIVYNPLGQKIKTLFEGVKPAGNYITFFNGSDLASGVYYYQLQSDKFIKTKKLVLLK
ncbi:MAG: family 43 glycosylhydrolase [Candidatus Marinimicrobia bacterium]|nr:family 43 glycosylhydrolase [Candidatus Neomarinimicrobiota bacterium]